MTVNVVIPSSTLGPEQFGFRDIQPAFPLFLDWRLIYQTYFPSPGSVSPLIPQDISSLPPWFVIMLWFTIDLISHSSKGLIAEY